ncbi:coagulation factor IXb [Diretmus argenteus]
MARVCLLAFTAGLLLETYGLGAAVTEENTGSVFVPRKLAAAVLHRYRRYNSGRLEELSKDNLERECREEICNFEEAREVFENDDKTVDEDQCEPSPCKNGGVCEDGIRAYVCWCKQDFSGKNCEIEVSKQCSVNNGGCSHFCVMQSVNVVCQCAPGYKLGPDKRSCEPTEKFSCGVVSKSIISSTRSLLTAVSSNGTGAYDMSSEDTLQDEDYDFNATLHYGDYGVLANDFDVLNISQPSTEDPDLLSSSVSSTLTPTEVVVNSSGLSSVTEAPPTDTAEKKDPSFWNFFPTVAPIRAQNNVDQRIVGGSDAVAGEIPWQVTLMDKIKQESFCGGSLLSEVWVITAAHCLTPANVVATGFFVRVGELDLYRKEGTERDHLVAEQFIHPHYDDKKSQYNHDIALLKLSSPVELSEHRRPICLGPKQFIEDLLRDSRNSLVSGWGRLRFQGAPSPKLQKVEVPYVDRTQCKGSSRDHITRFMFCAGYQSEQMDSCQGDSGGPHATNHQGTWFLTGIVSWGEECAMEGKYGIYTRVSRYYAWISQTTGIRINSNNSET